jgi:hypothetical protein
VIGVMSQGILESTCLSCLLGFFLALALDVVISAEGSIQSQDVLRQIQASQAWLESHETA